MKKIKIAFFILCMTLLTLCCSAEDLHVRVGLNFGSGAVSQVKLSFENGFSVGYLNDEEESDDEETELFSVAMFFPTCDIYVEATDENSFCIYDASNDACLFETESGRDALFCPAGDDRDTSYILYSGIKYPYYMLLSANDGGSVNVINLVEVERYIKGVLPSEIYPSWHEEALRSSAVAARTFTYKSLGGKHKAYGVDVCKTTCCQVYSGISKCTDSTDKAVDDTCGEVLVYDGKLITAVYHAVSGGITESAAGAWGSDPESFPYLTVVETPFEKYEELSSGKWERFITDDEMSSLISASSYKDKLRGRIVSVTADGGENGYLHNMTLTDEEGNTVTVKTSSSVYSLFSKYAKSACFEIERMYLPTEDGGSVSVLSSDGLEEIQTAAGVQYLTAEGEKTAEGISGGFYIDGKGFGHGVGMSQYGSQYAAKEGYTYDEILGIYYPGAVLADISELD